MQYGRVRQLGYVGITTTSPASWREFAGVIGAQIVDVDGAALGIRLDNDRAARMIIHEGDEDAAAYIGWETSGPEEFRAVIRQLESKGTSVVLHSELADVRGVQEVAAFDDPDGFPTEIYWGARTTIRTPYISPHGVDFVSQETGMGHVTFGVSDFDETRTFYSDALGMKLTEIADVGQNVVGFMRCNPRHHSLAWAELPPGMSRRLLHISVEVAELDALGAIRDRVFDSGSLTVDRDLGRHPTDDVISLYVKVNDAIEMELGWGSCSVEDATWDVDRYKRRGWSWGHRAMAPIDAKALGA